MQARSNSILWVIATLAVAFVPQLPRMPIPIALMTTAPLLWRFGAEMRNWSPLPNLVRYMATALSLVALVVSYGGLFGRHASVSLLAAMLALKLLECDRIRDARLVVSFSFFLCATQFLFTQGIYMLFYGVATIVAGLIALAQLQREEAFEAAGETPTLKISMVADLAFSLRLLLLAIPVAIAFFLFFPRWASPLWGVPESTLDAKTGLSDSMSPGSIQSLFMDDSPALRATFDGPLPSRSQLYWRGPVFWTYRTIPGPVISTAAICGSKPCRMMKPPFGAIPCNWNRMNEIGCSHWTIPRSPRRIPASRWISNCGAGIR